MLLELQLNMKNSIVTLLALVILFAFAKCDLEAAGLGFASFGGECDTVGRFAAPKLKPGGQYRGNSNCQFNSNREFFRLDVTLTADGKEVTCSGVRVQVKGWGKENQMTLTSKGNC